MGQLAEFLNLVKSQNVWKRLQFRRRASQVWPVLIKRALCVLWLGLAWPSRGAKGRLPDFVSSFSAAALIKIITRIFFCVFCCFFSATAFGFVFAAWKPQIWSVLWSRFVSCLYIGSAAPLPRVVPPPLSHFSSGHCWRPFSSRALFPLAMWMVSLLDRHRPIAI